jgi:hypothetical protein
VGMLGWQPFVMIFFFFLIVETIRV